MTDHQAQYPRKIIWSVVTLGKPYLGLFFYDSPSESLFSIIRNVSMTNLRWANCLLGCLEEQL